MTASLLSSARPGPVPLPDGPLETYAQRVAFGSLGAGGLTFVATRNPRRTADVLLAAVPRAARLGRESFAASAGRVLAGRDVVPMDARVLRRLDRIDTVVVDAELLDEPSAPMRTLLDAVHAAAQDLVIAGTPSDGARVADADLVVAGGEELATSVRALQSRRTRRRGRFGTTGRSARRRGLRHRSLRTGRPTAVGRALAVPDARRRGARRRSDRGGAHRQQLRRCVSRWRDRPSRRSSRSGRCRSPAGALCSPPTRPRSPQWRSEPGPARR